MKRNRIAALLAAASPDDRVMVRGWIRTRRDGKNFSFIELNDGSCLKNIQVVANAELPGFEAERLRMTTGASAEITGRLVASQGGGQQWEIQADAVRIIGEAPEAYPLQKKRHTDEFLRTIAHLRPRTNKYGAAFRVRAELAWAIHRFFHDRGFHYVHTPILTGSDCEGAGELFRVTALDPASSPRKKDGSVDYGRDFFGREANLTVSGQLSAEMLALALGDVYTFGPTFRAENSNTSRHAAEFWMVEPEMAFCDLTGNMELARDLVQYLVRHALDHCADDIDLFARFVDKDLLPTLENIVDGDFIRLPYDEAVTILTGSGQKFEYEVKWGVDFQSEHERFLTEVHFKKPVILYNYPKTIKPFYMRTNDDGRTVAAMDVLVPGVGEIVGGSQREERLNVLESRMDDMGMDSSAYWWYLDSRRFGTAPHAGFGMGFERVLMMVTGIRNIRDVIPFPRTPGAIEF